MQVHVPKKKQKVRLLISADFIALLFCLAFAYDTAGSSIVDREFVIVDGNNKNGITIPVIIPYISMALSELL